MKGKQIKNDKNALHLYRIGLEKQRDQHDLNQGNKQVREKNNNMITLDLKKWRLLAYGCAHWIFQLSKQRVILPNFVDSTTQGFSKSCQKSHNDVNNKCDIQTFQFSNNYNNKYEQNGGYVFRFRQLKWIQKSVNIRTDIILHNIINTESNSRINTQNSQPKQNNQKDLKNFLTQLEKEQDNLALYNLKAKSPLYILLIELYDQFLTNCLDSKQQNLTQTNQSFIHEGLLLPQISKSLVRQSERFCIYNQYEKNIENIDNFIEFITRQLIFFRLRQKLKEKSINLTEQQLAQIINQNLKTYPIKYEPMRSLVIKEQVSINFQSNLRHFDQVKQNKITKQLSHNQISAYHEEFVLKNMSDESYQVKINQVFEFKTKTILPDTYTQQFIDYFVKQHKNCSSIKQLVKFNQNNRTIELQKDKQSRTNLQWTQQDIKKTIIKQIQETIDKENPDKFSRVSTRQFKKNCLLTKKKNENFAKYFINCFKKNDYFAQSHVNYYKKQHLKKVVIQNIKEVRKQDNGDNVIPENNKSKNKEQNKQLHDHIINLICCEKKHEEKKLSLMEEILAVQMIETIDQISQQNQYQHNQGCSSKFCSSLYVQKISHSLASLALNKSANDLATYMSQRESNQKIFPSKSFQSTKNAFHPRIYSKSQKLSKQLKNIIFTSHSVDKFIEQILSFYRFQTETKNMQKPINQNKPQFEELSMKIKKDLFCLLKFLISLTWKDISIIIRQNMTSKFQRKYVQQHSLLSKIIDQNHPNKPKIDIKDIEQQINLVNEVISQSSGIKRNIIDYSIIDYNLKTLQSIDKNVTKTQEYLHNFLKYQLQQKS